MKRIGIIFAIIALALLPSAAFATDVVQTGSLGAVTGATVVPPQGVYSSAEVQLEDGGSANLTWFIKRIACAGCAPIQIATGTQADLPVAYVGSPGYAYAITVTIYAAGTLNYKVISKSTK